MTSRARRRKGAMSPALARVAAPSHCSCAPRLPARKAGSRGAQAASASCVASGVRQYNARQGTCAFNSGW